MSTILMSACWPLQGMSPAQKAVLISLADQANDDGYCWPSVKTISTRTCLSERAVQGAIRWLQQANILGSSERSGTSTVYRITPAAYAPPQEMHPADAAPRGAGDAPPPPQMLHPTPADAAPKPSLNRNLNRNEPSLVVADAPKAKACRATVLPSDFMPNETAEKMADELGLSISAEQAAFEDHHSAKGTTFKDWQAAFRTWLRNANKFRKPATVGYASNAPIETYAQRAARQRVEEVSPMAARKAPAAGFDAAQRFMNGGDVIDVTPRGQQQLENFGGRNAR